MLAQTSTSASVMPFVGSEVATSYDAARAVILAIPHVATTSYRQGTENGLDALLEASQQVKFYDEELDWEVCRDVGIYTHAAIADTRNGGNVRSEEMLLPHARDGI